MFHIAIVDDDQAFHQKLEEMITSILFKYPIPFKVSHFFSFSFLNILHDYHTTIRS